MYCFMLLSTPRELDTHIREMHSFTEKYLEPHRSKMVFSHPLTMPNLLHSSKLQIKTTEKTICLSLNMFRLNTTQSSSVVIKFTITNNFERI